MKHRKEALSWAANMWICIVIPEKYAHFSRFIAMCGASEQVGFTNFHWTLNLA